MLIIGGEIQQVAFKGDFNPLLAWSFVLRLFFKPLRNVFPTKVVLETVPLMNISPILKEQKLILI